MDRFETDSDRHAWRAYAAAAVALFTGNPRELSAAEIVLTVAHLADLMLKQEKARRPWSPKGKD
jgi:sigma54-dependent transcription regulator